MTSQRKKILLVEDEAIIALAEKRDLERYNYDTVIVHSGESAIEYIHGSNHVDLVLMDINLGEGIDGTETAMIILESKKIPIVFLSSHNEQKVVEKTEKITSYGYVVKASGITVLDASIKMAFKLFEEKNQRIHKELLLEESEEKFRSLVENTELGFYIVQNGLFTYVNDKLSECFGYKKEELENKLGPKDIIIGSEHMAMNKNIKDRMNNVKNEGFVVYKAIKKSGEIIKVHVTGTAMMLGGCMALLGAVIDELTYTKSLHVKSDDFPESQ